MAIANSYILAGFETLHFVQKQTFFNRFYFLQAFWSFLFVLSLPLNNDKYQGFTWDEDMLAPAHGFLFGASIPLYKVKPGAYYAIFGVAIFLLVFTSLLCTYVSNAIVKSALEKTWLATWFRVFCGLLATFWLPFLRIFLAPLDCDYFGKIAPFGNPSEEMKLVDAVNLNWSDPDTPGSYELCNDGAGGVILWAFCILIVIFFSLAFAFQSLAHVNDPRSWSALARPHCLMDLYNNVGITVLAIAFVVLRGHPSVVGFFYFLHQFLAFLFCVLAQPYYDLRFSKFRAAMFAATSWVGLTFFVVTFGDRGSGLSSALTAAMYIGLFLSLPAGWFLSQVRFNTLTKGEWDRIFNNFLADKEDENAEEGQKREAALETDRLAMEKLREDLSGANTAVPNGWEINKSLTELTEGASATEVPTLWKQGYVQVAGQMEVLPKAFARTRDGVPQIMDKQLSEWLKDYYIAGVSQSVLEWLDSLCVEVAIRRLYWPKCNNLAEKDRTKLDIAELVLKWGMMRHPQSTYLRLQLMVLKVFRSQMTSKENQKSNWAVERQELNDLDEMGLTLDLQFSVFRKRKDLDHLNDSIGGADLDTISYEEVKKRQKTAFYEHKKCLNDMTQVWSLLKDSSQNKMVRIANLLERIWETEQLAQDAYEYVVNKVSVDASQGSEVHKQYAKFLRDVKEDAKAAQVYFDKCKFDDQSRSQENSKSMDHTVSSAQEQGSKEGQKLITNLKTKLRMITILLVVVLLVLFVVYLVLTKQYQGTLKNLNESGARRTASMIAATDARLMHENALHWQLSLSMTDEDARSHTAHCAVEDENPQHHPLGGCGSCNALRCPDCTPDQYDVLKKKGFTTDTTAVSGGGGHRRRAAAAHGSKLTQEQIDSTTLEVCAVYACCRHVFRTRDDYKFYNEAEFKHAGEVLEVQMNNFWYYHNNLVHEYPPQIEEQLKFYRENNDYIEIHEASTEAGQKTRTKTVSGADVAWGLITNARVVGKSPMVRFQQFDRHDPSTFPELYYVLENSDITARAMDQSTMNYVLEATDVANRMRAIFISLCVVCSIIELITVIFIFRREVVRVFADKQNEISKLKLRSAGGEIDGDAVAFILKDMKMKAKQSRARSKDQARNPNLVQSKALGDSTDESSSEGSDAEVGKGPSKPKAGFAVDDNANESEGENSDDSDDSDASGAGGDKKDKDASKDENKDKDSAAVAATSQRENFLAIFYWACLLFIWGCLVFLGYTCVRAITEAEGSTVELNNASRRRYLGARIARFNKELIDSRDPSVSLIGGTLTWQNSTDLMRCLLRRSAQAMLSVHYAVLYGTKLGFVDLPVKQNWENGPVLQFGRGADEDYCSPFTWDRAGFLTSIDLPGSIGRYEPQDVVYFEKSCLTELPLDLMHSNSYEFTDERIRHFAMHYDRSKCSLYHADDPVTTQGLHNFVLYMTDLAITLAEAPDKALTDTNREYEKLAEHNDDEWLLGLEKSTLIYQHEALAQMDGTSTVVGVLYAFVTVVVLLQFVFLGRKIEDLMMEKVGLSQLVNRFVNKALVTKEHMDSRKTQEETLKGTGKDGGKHYDDSEDESDIGDDSQSDGREEEE